MVASTEAGSGRTDTSQRPVKPATIRINGHNGRTEGSDCKDRLRDYVADCMQQYFSTLNGHQPSNLYEMVIGDIEAPLLEAALNYCEGNQSRAAELLGLNRGTLRKKLRSHNITL